MSRTFTQSKVDAARSEKNRWKRRASSAEVALRRIEKVLRNAEDESDTQLLENVWEIVQDWLDAFDEQSNIPINSLRIKAYIFPLSVEERTSAEAALDEWRVDGGSLSDGVHAVLEAVATHRDPLVSRGRGL